MRVDLSEMLGKREHRDDAYKAETSFRDFRQALAYSSCSALSSAVESHINLEILPQQKTVVFASVVGSSEKGCMLNCEISIVRSMRASTICIAEE